MYYCCQLMANAIQVGYLLINEDNPDKFPMNKPPKIPGPSLTRTGKRKRNNLTIHFCPFCGQDLREICK